MFRPASFLSALVGSALLCLGARTAQAYALTGSHWTSSPVTMQLQLGSNSTPLSDGSSSWGASAEDALSTWNSYIGAMQFTVVRNSTAPKVEGNGINNVFFSGDVYGQAWGTGVLAVTLTYTSGATSTAECDVLFNSTLNWDSYRGALRYNTSGQVVFDFHRVALHEFGHVVGLDHPDQAGQSVVAIMNSTISNLDSLATDDITGAQSLYGPNTATSTVTAPVISTQPTSRTVTAGQSASFTVSATSSTTVSYQWYKNGSAISGATSATLTLSSVTTSAAGNYYVVVSNSAGSTTSSTATLTVTAPTVSPTIATQPTSQTVNAGTSVTFSVVASGTGPLTYAWRKNGTALSGATQASYTIASAQTTDAATYSVVVANSAGSVTSNGAILTIKAPSVTTVAPAITTAPIPQTVSAGTQLTLSVTATGSPAPTYQWLKNGVAIAGATQATLTVSSTLPSDTAAYSVVVANSAGSVTTTPVQVTVIYSQLVNLSARGYVPTGGALTAGFVMRGSSAKPILVRGIGPTLSTLQVTNPLANPNLTIIAQGTFQTLAVNDGWSQTPQLASVFQSVGAFALPSGSADAAAEVQLTPGAYTARVTSDTGTSNGVALAELYDADPATFATRLINVSALGFAGPGQNALVAGFVIQGNTAKHLLIRAVGPGLQQLGVTGWLANPRLDVYPMGQSTAIGGNDDWGNSSALANAASTVGAFPLPANSTDAALITTLAPGGYTVVVTGVDTSTGYALVEIYDLDP